MPSDTPFFRLPTGRYININNNIGFDIFVSENNNNFNAEISLVSLTDSTLSNVIRLGSGLREECYIILDKFLLSQVYNLTTSYLREYIVSIDQIHRSPDKVVSTTFLEDHRFNQKTWAVAALRAMQLIESYNMERLRSEESYAAIHPLDWEADSIIKENKSFRTYEFLHLNGKVSGFEHRLNLHGLPVG